MGKADEKIKDIDYKIMENNEAEQKRERRRMEHKNRLSELSDYIKCNICILRDIEEKEKEKGEKSYLRKS